MRRTALARPRCCAGSRCASIVANVVIVVTGGAVRLTGSGLGCPTWPGCTEDSYIATAAMGVHGVIEFGNRLLTFAVGPGRRARGRRRLAPAAPPAAADPAWPSRCSSASRRRACVGGMTVLTDLNPWVVGCHFLVSMAVIAAAYAFWRRHRRVRRAGRRARAAGAAARARPGSSPPPAPPCSWSAPCHRQRPARRRRGRPAHRPRPGDGLPGARRPGVPAAGPRRGDLVRAARRRRDRARRYGRPWLVGIVLAQGVVGVRPVPHRPARGRRRAAHGRRLRGVAGHPEPAVRRPAPASLPPPTPQTPPTPPIPQISADPADSADHEVNVDDRRPHE